MAAKKTKEARSPGEPPKRRRVRVKTGQLAAVPLLDGTYALVHVALYNGNIIVAHFAHRRSTPEELLEGLVEALKGSLIAIFEVTSDEIYDGHWKVIGEQEPTYPSKLLDMKGRSYGAASTRAFLEAYYGLRPWDELYDPRDYEYQLLPGVLVPPTVRYKRDFEREAAAAANKAAAVTDSAAAAEPTVTEGPAKVHIEIRYAGEGLPSLALLKRRHAIEEALESAKVGDIPDAGAGDGVMEILLETEDVARALPFVRAAIKEAGLADCTRVTVTRLEKDDTGEDDAEDA